MDDGGDGTCIRRVVAVGEEVEGMEGDENEECRLRLYNYLGL